MECVDNLLSILNRYECHVRDTCLLRGCCFSGELFNAPYNFEKGFSGDIEKASKLVIIFAAKHCISKGVYPHNAPNFTSHCENNMMIVLGHNFADLWELLNAIDDELKRRNADTLKGTLRIETVSDNMYEFLKKLTPGLWTSPDLERCMLIVSENTELDKRSLSREADGLRKGNVMRPFWEAVHGEMSRKHACMF